MVMVPILIVDDQPANLEALRALLAAPDYDVVSAASGTAALEELEARDFAVVLLDVQMPVMDGIETASKMRAAAARSRRAPILFMSAADADRARVLRAYASGAVDFLQKPFEPEVLLAKVAVFADLYRVRAELKAAEEDRLAAVLLENMPELAWTARADGHVDLYNRRWFEFTGTTLEEIEGWGWQKVHDPAVLPAVVERWKHSIATGAPFEMEFPIRGADGRFRWFLTRARPRRDAAGKVVRWFGTTTDIDEERRARQFQERFVAILGHDLRNPLSAIDMATGVLRHRAEKAGDAATPRVLDRIQSSSRRMARMIDQILDLSRTRIAGGLEMKLTSVDLASLLTGIVEELRAVHPSRTVELRCPPSVGGRWDRDRLEQVFSNLIGNAIRHGAPDRPVRVTAVVGDALAPVRVYVHNEGRPIPEELLASIFNPFRRGERESRGPGTEGLGLGLYISREIVVAHRGTIEVRSSAVEGTTFQVLLPRQSSTPSSP